MIFVTVTMAIKLPEPTLFCVITIFVWLSSLYDQDIPSLYLFIFLVAVVVACIVIGHLLSGRDGLVSIPLVNTILSSDSLARGSGLGGVSWCNFIFSFFVIVVVVAFIVV